MLARSGGSAVNKRTRLIIVHMFADAFGTFGLAVSKGTRH